MAEAQMAVTAGEYATGTGSIFYEVIEAQEAGSGEGPAGKGPWLTLLHNFMSTGRTAWGPLLPELSRGYRVLLPDLPGHGRSIGYPARYDHGAMARQVAALMAAVGAEGGHLAGCSSGGMVAQRLVAEHIGGPATLTLVSTTYNVAPAVTGVGRVLIPEHFQASATWLGATARLHDGFRYDGYFDQELLPGFRRLNPQTAIGLTLDDLGGFDLPVCLIQGERDEFFPPAIPTAMAAALPDAELHLIPNQTHALIFRQPWQVAKRMVQFLSEHPL